MNATTNTTTTINIHTTNAKGQAQSEIKRVVIYDLRGNGRVVEKLRGIQI